MPVKKIEIYRVSFLFPLHKGQQKSSPDKSDELLIFYADILSCGSDLSVPITIGVELAPFLLFPAEIKERLSRLHRAITLCLS